MAGRSRGPHKPQVRIFLQFCKKVTSKIFFKKLATLSIACKSLIYIERVTLSMCAKPQSAGVTGVTPLF